MDRADVDRNLLFGLLALQTGLIDRPALTEALRAWARDKSRGLAEILADQGALPARRGTLLGALVGEHVEAHGGDPTRSLASVDAGASTREALRAIGDPDLDATVDVIGSATTEFVRSTRTEAFDVGSSTDGGRRFRVLRPHRKGGLGAVFVALDSELNREVALKQILEKHADDPASRSRFLLEAEITGGLEHPGIVPVYGLGTFDDGRPYYAMRFIRGDSLKEAIARFHGKPVPGEGPPAPPSPPAPASGVGKAPAAGSRELELRKLLRRFLDVCNAIEYAHRRGILHRDLKPGNVMVGKYGETLVVDWGLAKAVGHPEPGSPEGEGALAPSHSSGSVETLPGSAIGTPAYMSPEQAAGDLEHLGSRSDVYSLGATLYCLLTGHPPYEGPDAGAVIQAVRGGNLAPPRKHDPTIDRALEAVCLKAMAYRPEARYASPAALAEEVERWMADEPVAAFPEPTGRRLARWARRHSSAVTGGGVFLIGAVLALGLVAWLVARQNRRLEAARLEASVAGAMAHTAVRTLLSDVVRNELLDIPKGELLRVKLAERALGLYRDFVKLHPDDAAFGLEQARIEEQVAGLYRMIGKFPRARVEYDAAIARLNGLLARDPDSTPVLDFLAYTEEQLAEMIKLSGGPDAEAEPHYREAVRLAEGLRVRQPGAARYARLLAITSSDLAGMLTNAGRLDEAGSAYAGALAAAVAFDASLPRVPDPDQFSFDRIILPMVRSNLAGVLAKLGRAKEAEAACLPAVASFRALVTTYPRSNDLKYLLSNALKEVADARAADPARAVEAARDLDEAVGLFEPLVGQFPNIAFYPKFLVSLRADRGAVRLAAGQLGPSRDDLAFADEKLAARLVAEKEAAEPLREQGKVKASLARLADREADRAKARMLADEAVDLQQRVLAIDPPRPADRALLDRHRALRKELEGPGR